MYPPVIVVLGPTGVGKTSLAIELAQLLNGEIISADSRQIYRHMDIGTAKPTPAQLAVAPHHMIDRVDPDETLTLAEYCDQARQTIGAIVERGNLAFLVGGSGQYLAAMLEGWQVPRIPPQPALRARLRQRAEAEGSEALYRHLQQIDPQAAARILPGNLRRIIRALEVYDVSGIPFSQQQGREAPPYNWVIVGLTMERPALYQRVDHRAEEMVRQGLVEEVRMLLGLGYGWDLPAMSGLGYLQFRPYLEQTCRLEDALERLKFDTHAFIRHQYTWFRRFPVQHWFDAASPEEMAQVIPHLQHWLAAQASNPSQE